MTSQGIGDPFAPGEKIMGYQACEVHGGCYIDIDDIYGEKLTHLVSGSKAIFRYVKSDNDWSRIAVTAKGKGELTVLMNDQQAGKVKIDNLFWRIFTAEITAPAGEYELSFEAGNDTELELAEIWIY